MSETQLHPSNSTFEQRLLNQGRDSGNSWKEWDAISQSRNKRHKLALGSRNPPITAWLIPLTYAAVALIVAFTVPRLA